MQKQNSLDTFIDIENAAQLGAFGLNSAPTPTDAQCKAGNYKLGRIRLYGLPVAIEQPRHSYRTGVDPKTGKRWTNRLAAHYGYFSGTKGNDGDPVDCFVGFFPRSEYIYVINQHVDGRFDEHKCMIAFPDEQSARNAYLQSYDRGWSGLKSMIKATINQFKWWLKNGNMKAPLAPEHLPFDGIDTMKRIYWDSATDQPKGMTLDQLLYQVRKSDSGENLLLDSVGMTDILEEADEIATFDAMVTPYAKLQRKMEVLQTVMDRAGSTVKPVAMQISDPFKQGGVAQVAAVFELSDGQTITIYFHNPDVDPRKIQQSDELISWKWLLNKKEISIIVAPERGEDLNVRDVARRIMKLAEKNSPAFQRANAKRAEKMQAIQGLKDEIVTLEKELKDAQHELEVARVEAEDRLLNPPVKQAEPIPVVTQEPVEQTPTEPELEQSHQQPEVNAEMNTELNPSSPDDYAKIMANPELQLQYQDILDSFFQPRIIDVRNALRELGWEGEKYGELSKNGYAAKFSFKHVGAGANVVGYWVNIMDGPDSVKAEIGDKLTGTATDVAAQIDAVVTNSGAVTAENYVDNSNQKSELDSDALSMVKERLSNVKTIVTEKPPVDDVNKKWLLLNAPRPLVGDKTFENGEFNHGRFYAALDPGGEFFNQNLETNLGLDAYVILVLEKETIDNMLLGLLSERLMEAYNRLTDEKKVEYLKSNRGKLSGKTFSEIMALWTGVQDAPETNQEPINETVPDLPQGPVDNADTMTEDEYWERDDILSEYEKWIEKFEEEHQFQTQADADEGLEYDPDNDSLTAFNGTAFLVEQAVKEYGGRVQWGNFDATAYNGSIFDSAINVGGIVGQIADKDGNVVARIRIEENGVLTVFSGASGVDKVSEPTAVVAKINSAIDTVFGGVDNKLSNQPLPHELSSNPEPMEDESTDPLASARKRVNSAEFQKLTKGFLHDLSTIKGIDDGTIRGYTRALFVNSVTGKLKRMAPKDPELTSMVLAWIHSAQKGWKKPAISSKNGVWGSVEAWDKYLPLFVKQEDPEPIETTQVVNNEPETENKPVPPADDSEVVNQPEIEAATQEEADTNNEAGDAPVEQQEDGQTILETQEPSLVTSENPVKAAFEAELNALKLETDIESYLGKLEAIAGRVEAAGLMEEMDGILNETADKLTALMAEAEKNAA